ncbi:hypothetical protein M426DRAFT_324892 [Hypoxylon sp. CI-4A]|nr:hypothetical protein M426DRAFT_324892 [Hypoxylon sp. CI-4A]
MSTGADVDADEALRRRRERGRRSQAGFRKRQAEANQHLRDENDRLKKAIETLVGSIRGDERPELRNAIRDVAEVAGVDAPRPAPDSASSNSDATQSTNRQMRGERRSVAPNHSDESATTNVSTGDSTCNDGCQGSSASSNSLTLHTTSSKRDARNFWLDPLHYMKVSTPPDDIVPYLGAKSKTFSGIIFWSMLDHVQDKCPHHHAERPAVLIQRGMSHSKVMEELTPAYIEAMVEARQEYRQTGIISSQYASAAEPDLPRMVGCRVYTEYRARGMDFDQWLSILEIEKRVRDMVGEDVFAVLDRAARGIGDPGLRRSFEGVLCKLSETAVCFGDSPRWRVEVVDKIFISWVLEACWSNLPR